MVKVFRSNTKNEVGIEWLTHRKVACRFMIAGISKRDFFKIVNNLW